jgi:hypothetical protein
MGDTMQHVTVASGEKKEGRVENVGASDLVLNCLRLAPPVFFHLTESFVPERFRDAPEYKNLVLRLTEVEHG